MKRSHALPAGILAAVAIAALLFLWLGFQQPAPTAATSAKPAAGTTTSPSAPASASPISGARSTSAAVAQNGAAYEDAPFEGPMFPTDASGHIIKSENVRLNLEQLYALNTPDELAQKVDALRESLPPAAARELPELMEQYKNYQTAARQAFPPGHEAPSAADAVNELDGLHALRVQYFGAAATDAFFSSEEKVQRELLRLMALDKDQSLTMEEKAERAQALYSQSPELARLGERAARDAAQQ